MPKHHSLPEIYSSSYLMNYYFKTRTKLLFQLFVLILCLGLGFAHQDPFWPTLALAGLISSLVFFPKFIFSFRDPFSSFAQLPSFQDAHGTFSGSWSLLLAFLHRDSGIHHRCLVLFPSHVGICPVSAVQPVSAHKAAPLDLLNR